MLAIINGNIYTMKNGQIFENGSILIDEGKIIDIGENIDIPEDAKIIDAEGLMVTPGLVDGHSHIGIGEEGIGWEGMDYNETSDPITPQMRAIDAINPRDLGIREALEGGVTTSVTGPGSANAVGGTFVAIKNLGRRIDKMVIKDPVAMKMAFGENVKRVYKDKGPNTRMGIAAAIRELLYKTVEYQDKKESGKNPDFNMKYEAMIPVIKGELPVKAHAHRSDDIFTAIRIAKEFNLKMTIEHSTEGHLIADYLKEEGLSVICGPNMSSAGKYETRNKSYATPRVMYENNIKFGIMTDNSVIPTPLLPVAAGMAVKSGLPMYEALKAITISNAEITGIDDRVGSLEVGKDGDVVIWSKNPVLDIDCVCKKVIVDGMLVFDNKREEANGK